MIAGDRHSCLRTTTNLPFVFAGLNVAFNYNLVSMPPGSSWHSYLDHCPSGKSTSFISGRVFSGVSDHHRSIDWVLQVLAIVEAHEQDAEVADA
jgi:hypothetical protein